MDSLIISIFLSPLEVGFYNAAIPIALLLHIIPELFYPLFFPLITRMASSSNKEVASDISKQLGKWIFMINLPIFIFLFLFPESFIKYVFSTEFLAAANSLRILSVGAFISSFLYISQRLLLMGGFSRIILLNSIIALAANLVLNVALVPVYGITGAAIATSSVWIILGIISTIQCLRLTSIFPIRRKVVAIMLISILPIIFAYLFRDFIESSLVRFIAGAALFFAIYFMLVYAFALDKNDMSILRALKKKLFAAKNDVHSN